MYSVDVEVLNEKRVLGRSGSKAITPAPDLSYHEVQSGSENLKERPVVIGVGPAGLFAGLLLSRKGYRPVILERGEEVETRTAKINRFWNDGLLIRKATCSSGKAEPVRFLTGNLLP